MPRASSVRVKLARINQDCRPNCCIPIPTKFAEQMGWESEPLDIPSGKSNVVWPSLAEDAATGDGVSLKVEDWNE